MRILIIGASGFIGQNIINFYKNNKSKEKILGTFNSNIIKNQKFLKNISFIKLNYFQKNYQINKIKDFDPNVIIFLGWNSIPDFSKQKSIDNYNYAHNLFEKLFKIKSLKKVVALGSCYELKPDIKTKYFVKSKINLKNILLKKSKTMGINFFWLRIFYVYGPYQSSKSLIPSLYKNFISKKELILKNPNLAHDFIFIDDVIKKIKFIIKSKKLKSGVYNIGTSNLTRVKDIAYLVKLTLLNKLKKNKTKINHKKIRGLIAKPPLINNNNKFTEISIGISKTLKYLKN